MKYEYKEADIKNRISSYFFLGKIHSKLNKIMMSPINQKLEDWQLFVRHGMKGTKGNVGMNSNKKKHYLKIK